MKDQTKVKNPSRENLSYEGSVSASVYKNTKRLRNRKYKNNGGYPLFQFLALSACGLFRDAEFVRPKYVQLFHIAGTGDQDPTEEQIKTALETADPTQINNMIRSSRVIYKSTPAPIKGNDSNKPAFSTTLEFMIPFAQIINSGEPANAIVLFYTASDNETKKYCAFARFDSTLLEGNISEEYNLFIEWTLTFANKE